MAISDGTRRTVQGAQSNPAGTDSLPLDHYFRLLWHRKWWVLAVWVVVSATTYVIVRRLPDVYMSETVILVDPQKVARDKRGYFGLVLDQQDAHGVSSPASILRFARNR